MKRLIFIVLILVCVSSCANLDSSPEEVHLHTRAEDHQTLPENLIWWDIYPPHFIFRLDLTTRVMYIVLLSCSLTIALFAKVIILKGLMDGLFDKPANLLIMVEQVIRTLQRSSSHLATIAALAFNIPLNEFLGESFFTLFWMATTFGLVYNVVGTCGTTCFRMLYLKFSMKILYKERWWALSLLTLTLSLSIAAAWTIAWIFWAQAIPKSPASSLFTGFSGQSLAVFSDYKEENVNIRRLLPMLLLPVHFLKVGMYLNFTIFMYRHDKSMLPLISQQNYKQRRRKATISFACEMYCYFFEAVIIIWILIRNFTEQYAMDHAHGFLYVVYGQLNFALTGVLEALSISMTRDAFILHINRVLNCFTIIRGRFLRRVTESS